MDDLAQPVELAAEHALVQEEDRGERLVLRGRGDAALGGEAGQERGDLGLPHLVGMSPAVEPDEPADPAEIGLLGARCSAGS